MKNRDNGINYRQYRNIILQPVLYNLTDIDKIVTRHLLYAVSKSHQRLYNPWTYTALCNSRNRNNVANEWGYDITLYGIAFASVIKAWKNDRFSQL